MMNVNIEDIGSYLKRRIETFQPKNISYQYGQVTSISDGVVRISGLPGRRYGELLEFDGDSYGMALELEENGVGAVMLSAQDDVRVGAMVRGTNRVTEVPVGNELLGRVVDPIGRACFGEPIEAKKYFPTERPAPSLIARRPIDKPLETGILAVDSMIPIGRGQRELIIGDRQTGKTSIALDTIINQKRTDVVCVYCAIGQKASTIAQVIKTLTDNGAMDYSVVVASTASDSPAMQYLAPYSACSIAEYFMENGRDVLVVYDDLSKHAVAYRTMSLLLRRPMGREAYPGDVFYLHSRLLERAACLSHKRGGGSMTAIPIVETTGGNISAYIPTNVISITDGQIFLDDDLFNSGLRPAINTGLSVSRVGRSAQPKAMRKVSGLLRIQLAQYREMAVFARFGTDIDAATKEMLDRGEILTSLFKQKKSAPYTLAEKVLLLFAFNNGFFRSVPPASVPEVIEDLFAFMRTGYKSIISRLNREGDFDDRMAKEMTAALTAWSGRGA